MDTFTDQEIVTTRSLSRLLGINLPSQCLIHNDNDESKRLIAFISEKNIDLVLFRHEQADENALPILKIGDIEIGPHDPKQVNWLEFLAFEASQKSIK